MAKIDKKLNLVIPLDIGEGRTIHVHSSPIDRDVFNTFYAIIGQTFNNLHVMGFGIQAGARVAYLAMRDIAMKQDCWEGPEGVEFGLINDIDRHTHVMVPTPEKGWTMLPLAEAIAKGFLDEDDEAEVRNAIVFFTLVFTMLPKADFSAVMVIALRLWGARLESLNASAFMNSLAKSNATENSTGTAGASSAQS